MLARVFGIILFSYSASAQYIDPIWTYTMDVGGDSWFSSCCTVGDSGFVLIGHRQLIHDPDSFYVVRVSREGEEIWKQDFLSTAYDFYPYSPIVHNNEIWIAGSLGFFNHDLGVWRFSLDGDSLGIVGSGDGRSYGGGVLFENSAGNVLFVKSVLNDIQELYQIELSFLDDQGSIINTVAYDADSSERARKVVETQSGYLIAGTRNSVHPAVLHVGPTGELQWRTVLDLPGDGESLLDFVQLEDGSYYGVGFAAIEGRGHQGWLVKFSQAGDTVWSKSYGGTSADYFRSIIPTDSGFALVGGYSRQYGEDTHLDTWIVFVDENGDSLSQYLFSTSTSREQLMDVAAMDSSILLVGDRQANDLSHYVAEAKLIAKAPVENVPNAIEFQKMFMLHTAYPNPFNATTSIEFELPRSADVTLNIYDVQGRLVTTLLDEVAAAGVHSVGWGCAECASGLYFVRMSAGEFVATQKILLVK